MTSVRSSPEQTNGKKWPKSESPKHKTHKLLEKLPVTNHQNSAFGNPFQILAYISLVL